ncbi:MAG: ComEC/Rec2 family competence protein, partial [Planctomycetaceae bacterium]
MSLALALAAGITLDRIVDVDLLAVWAVLAVILPAMLFGLYRGPGRLSAVCVLILCGLAGVLSHHQMWWSVPSDDIGRRLVSQPVLMKIQGHVAERPMRLKARNNAHQGAIPQSDVMRFSLDCDSLAGPEHTVAVSGRLRVDVSTGQLDLARGDSVTVLGSVSGLPASRNPGEYNIANAFRTRELRGVMRVNCPELITVASTAVNPVTVLTDWLRARCESALDRSLSEQSLPIAAALLLGDRSMISSEIRSPFMESGTMHLLAVSGLHVGILTAFLFACCRVSGFSDRGSVILVLTLLAVYLGVADVRPPVLRAAVLASFWGIGRLLRRPPLSANSLAGAAIVVLTLNPSDLFNVGAQLSFLAVASILWAMTVRRELNSFTAAVTAPGVRSAEVLLPGWQQRLLPVWRWLWVAWRTTGMIWLLTTPLVASAFNIISPVGLAVNVLLIPLTGAALCVGLVSLGLGVVHPWLGLPLGTVFDMLLRGLLWSVDVSSRIPLGHFHVPAPSMWWLTGLYFLLAVAMLSVVLRRGRRCCWAGVLLWGLFGLSVVVQPAGRTGLRCTFLSVGHGL